MHNPCPQSRPAVTTAFIPRRGTVAAKKVLNLVQAEDGRFQVSLHDTYAETAHKMFKGLRPALCSRRLALNSALAALV